jgi:predicted choloylglycine hydrolase
MAYKKIKVSGTPYEIGNQVGRKAGSQIIRCMELYQEVFANVGVDWAEATQRAEMYVPVIEKYDRDLIAEMQGIADAINLPLIDIVTLNSRSEVMFSAQAVDGCTTVSITPPKTDGSTYVAQNWDHYSRFADVMIVLEIEQMNKPNILMVTEAGIIGKIGMNNAGIGVCLNAIGTEGTIGGLPIHLALRGVLNSRSIGEAIGASIQTKSANAANFNIASKEGVSVDVELANDGYDVMFNHDGVFVHTNHLTSSKLLTYVKDRYQEKVPDSHIRLGVAQREFRGIDLPITVEKIMGVLSNHINYPDSICRHAESDPKPVGKRGSIFETVFSIVNDVTEGVMYVAAGVPCKTEFVAYRFGE